MGFYNATQKSLSVIGLCSDSLITTSIVAHEYRGKNSDVKVRVFKGKENNYGIFPCRLSFFTKFGSSETSLYSLRVTLEYCFKLDLIQVC